MLLLRLPGNVERSVNIVRERLFGLTGALSTHALPPLLPLAYIPGEMGEEIADSLPQTAIAPLALGGPTVFDGTLVLEVDWPLPLRTYCQSVRSLEPPRHMPPPLSGVFIGSEDAAAAWGQLDAKARLSLDDVLSAVANGVAVFTLEMLSIEVAAQAEWWEHVTWEVRWDRRIKLRG